MEPRRYHMRPDLSTGIAREKFSVNDSVRLTKLGEELYSVKARRPGIVRGFGRVPQLVRIQREGIKSIESYHMDFWERVE